MLVTNARELMSSSLFFEDPAQYRTLGYWEQLNVDDFVDEFEWDSLSIGDEVTVLDFYGYDYPPKTPVVANISRIYEYPVICVKIDGVDWEVSVHGFGIKNKIQ